MDIQQSLLLFGNGGLTISYLVLIMILPIITKVFEQYINDLDLFETVKSYFAKEWNELIFSGSETIRGSKHCIDYPKPYIAVSYAAYTNNKINKLKHIALSQNGLTYFDPEEYEQDTKQNYVVNACKLVEIEKDIYLELHQVKHESKDNATEPRTTSTMIIKSKVKNINELKNFVQNCVDQYEKYLDDLNSNKIFHFIYKGCDSETKELNFTQQLISDYDDIDNINYETFDNIFHDHKNKIVNDVNLLKNVQYFRQHGLKRKKGYLFYGHPGCGKTSTVMAIANHTKRHIIEVPMSRVKTNSELEDIIFGDEINGIKYKKDQIVLLFDEIDSGNITDGNENESIDDDQKKDDKKDKDKTDKSDTNKLLELLKSPISKKPDELSLGIILSRFDGIGSYNGMILIATTNHKDKLPKSLYRHGRLDPLFFDYASTKDIVNMIEKFYSITLTDSEIEMLPSRENKLSHSLVKTLISENNEDVQILLKELNNLKNTYEFSE